MITQTITRWFGRLFAWWPWKRTSKSEYTQATNNVNRGTIQEVSWRAAGEDGPLPQPGTASVAVEHAGPHRPANDDHSGLSSPVTPSLTDETTVSPLSQQASSEEVQAPAPTPEQQLAFLQYLMRKGAINEGFEEGQVPDQYRRKRLLSDRDAR
ncbi:hypothetical protein [Tengunoibacter tsumagoiensis]|uniref:hypothetical protein n=1 Tax=Tengunoibacter tsumagoiensis TaxID=2014871 RepID=UPI000F827347|nr:hypothetical protein [Tengunoibacter tsumagoiensis]